MGRPKSKKIINHDSIKKNNDEKKPLRKFKKSIINKNNELENNYICAFIYFNFTNNIIFF